MYNAYQSAVSQTPPPVPQNPAVGYPTSGNPAEGIPATIPGPYWFHQQTQELTNVVLAAGMEPDIEKLNQVAEAIKSLIAKALQGASPILRFDDIPEEEGAPIIYVHPYGLMEWVSERGIYRSIDCGHIILGSTPTPRPGHIKANGASISKATYKGLWTYAQDTGLVVPDASWSAGTLAYGEIDDNFFRAPDLRGEFPRFWDDGRGADSGRAFGSGQADAFQGHRHLPLQGTGFCENSGTWNGNGSGSMARYGGATTGNPATDTVNGTPRTAAETRPRNVALPCHIKY
jgi:hypothetical protein